MIERKDEHTIVATYYSVDEYMDAATTGCWCGKANRGAENIFQTYRHAGGVQAGWLGLNQNKAVTQKSMTDLIRAGWDKGVKNIEDAAQEIDPPRPRQVRRRAIWSDHGSEVDMQRVWGGQLDTAWRRMQKADSTGPARVCVAVDTIAHAGMDAQSMAWRGAAAAALSDQLVSAGYAVRIVSAFHGTAPEDTIMRCIVKDYQSPHDTANLSGTTVFPGFFRYFGHLWGGRHLPAGHIHGGGYQTAELRREDVIDMADGGLLFIATQVIDDARAAQNFVRSSIESLDEQALAA